MLPLVVPFTTTLAPITAIPFVSVMVPVIVLLCWVILVTGEFSVVDRFISDAFTGKA